MKSPRCNCSNAAHRADASPTVAVIEQAANVPSLRQGILSKSQCQSRLSWLMKAFSSIPIIPWCVARLRAWPCPLYIRFHKVHNNFDGLDSKNLNSVYMNPKWNGFPYRKARRIEDSLVLLFCFNMPPSHKLRPRVQLLASLLAARH